MSPNRWIHGLIGLALGLWGTATSAAAAPEEAKLVCLDAAVQNRFGYSVGISGETIVVGAPSGWGPFTPEPGSAYVFSRNGTSWINESKLTVPSIATDFGYCVAISGDIIVVGSPWEGGVGAAYVFLRRGTHRPQWIQRAKLTGSGAVYMFGSAVAISGDTVLIGERFWTGPSGLAQGSAYIFVKPPGGWHDMTETQHLTAADATAGDQFGLSVGISGNSLVVGAPMDRDHGWGSAYVFIRSGAAWVQHDKITAVGPLAGDYFGSSVAISDDTIVIGATWEAAPAHPNRGPAYIFDRAGAVWKQRARLTASDAARGDNFGISVAVSAKTVVVGTNLWDRPDGADYGSGYVFVRSFSGWADTNAKPKLFASDGVAGDRFGNSVAIDKSWVVVGAFMNEGAAGVSMGSAYVYRLTP